MRSAKPPAGKYERKGSSLVAETRSWTRLWAAVALARAGYDVAVSARTVVDGTARLEDGETVLPGGLDTTVKEVEEAQNKLRDELGV